MRSLCAFFIGTAFLALSSAFGWGEEVSVPKNNVSASPVAQDSNSTPPGVVVAAVEDSSGFQAVSISTPESELVLSDVILVSPGFRIKTDSSGGRYGEYYYDRIDIRLEDGVHKMVDISVSDSALDGKPDHVDIAVEDTVGRRILCLWGIFLKSLPASTDVTLDWRKHGFEAAPLAMGEIGEILRELRREPGEDEMIHLVPIEPRHMTRVVLVLMGNVMRVWFEIPTPPHLAQLIAFYQNSDWEQLRRGYREN